MAFDKVKILFFVLCATVLVGVTAYASSYEARSHIHIGMFNSKYDAQKFYESLPEGLKVDVAREQLSLDVYKNNMGFLEHYINVAGLDVDAGKNFCRQVISSSIQCIISGNEPLFPMETEVAAVDAVQTSKLSKLKPLGLRPRRSSFDIADLDLALPPSQGPDDLLAFQRDIQTYDETFSLLPQSTDTPEVKAAKAAYESAKGQLLVAIQNIGEGLNRGEASQAVKDNLVQLTQSAFEAAGTAYISGFAGNPEVLPEGAGAGQVFVHHIKNNLSESTRGEGRKLLNQIMAGLSSQGGLEDGIFADTVDGLMLSSTRGLIEAGISAARRSDLYVLRNVELEYNLNNFDKPYFSFLGIQPVYQTADLRHSLFVQGGGIINEHSVDIDDDVSRHTVNVGAAYRYLTPDEKYLLGANAFFDHQWPYNHSRMSVGVDAKVRHLNVAANYYRPLSGFKKSRQDTQGNQYEEQALEGYDIELGYDISALPGLSVFGKGYQYFRDTAGEDDLHGLEASAEYSFRDFTFKGSYVAENGGRDGVELALQYNIPLYDEDEPNIVLADLKPAAGQESVRDKIFEKVRRENRLRVEERIVASNTPNITAQFSAASIGLPFDVGGVFTLAGVNLPYNRAITIPSGSFGIITFSNGAIANLSASGAGDVIVSFNATTLTVSQTGGGFVQFVSAGGGISVINVPGGTVNLLGTDIDITDDGTTTTIHVRAGQIEVVPDVGVDVENGDQGEVVSLTIATGATNMLSDPALSTRKEDAFTNLDLQNPDPPITATSAPFINAQPSLITGPQFVGNNADVQFTFTQPVTFTGTPQLTALVDANSRTFVYEPSASTVLSPVFRYVFVAGDVGATDITPQTIALNGGTIKGAANELDALLAFTSPAISISDQTAPGLTGSTPADEEPAFSAVDDIVLNFNENVQVGSGNIVITDTTDGSDNRTIAIGDAQISIVGSTITINPSTNLELSTDYDITIASGVIEDTNGNAFAGIASGELNFTTSNDVTPPSIMGTTPNDDATDAGLSDNIVLTFDEVVNKGTGNIEIRRTADGALLETIDVTTGLVTGGGTATITINPANDYPPATDVYVLIDAGAFEDLFVNSFAGIAATTTLNFRGFSPLDVPGILLWLDAHDLDGDGAPEGVAEGGLVAGDASVWEDKSGNSNDLSHATPSRRPTLTVAGKNGRDILNFDGGDALFATDASVPSLDLSGNEFTMYMVINPTNTNGRILINKETSYEVGLNSGRVQAAVVTTAPGSWNWGGTANNAITTAWHTVEFAHNNTMWDFYQDGALTESIVPANNQTGNIQPTNNIFTVGGRGTAAPTGSFFLGDIAEVLMFDHALTVQERADLEAYFAVKWAP